MPTHPPARNPWSRPLASAVRTRRRPAQVHSHHPDVPGGARGRRGVSPTRSAPRIVVPPPTCPSPHNNSVWFTKGTQSVKRAPSSGAPPCVSESSGDTSSNKHKATSSDIPSTLPNPTLVRCSWCRPMPAVVATRANDGLVDSQNEKTSYTRVLRGSWTCL